MVATLRQGYLVIVMAIVLLLGLIGWTMRVEMAAPLHHSPAVHTSQLLAGGPNVVCPPPPFDCRG